MSIRNRIGCLDAQTAKRRMGDLVWWGEAPERPIGFRSVSRASEPMMDNADARAEPLVPRCAITKGTWRLKQLPETKWVKSTCWDQRLGALIGLFCHSLGRT